jgi:hypothetical protein
LITPEKVDTIKVYSGDVESHNLYLSKQGTFLNAIPKKLFYKCASMTVSAYKSEGSYFLIILR